MAYIQAKDVTVQISTDSGVTYKTLVCEMKSGVKINRETTQTATKCDNGTVSLGLGSYTWSFDFEAVAKLSPASTEVTYSDFLGWMTAGTALMAKIDDTGAGFKHIGNVYITDLSLDLQNKEVAQFSGTLSGDGALTIA